MVLQYFLLEVGQYFYVVLFDSLYVHGAVRISGHSIIKIRNFNPIKLMISRQNYLPMG